ncbi:endolytic transglycosylase MltG [Chitinimonas sp. BJYL2]|uniref:endolytic transglycosylase MltG n=1 Tax=Chitinimonas sp. BJYL2 TaxID=2976696 RepID=UPI0027E4392C|nr:endolytic transglycosylase MltG [Chitinimonas sp. BJYL2]
MARKRSNSRPAQRGTSTLGRLFALMLVSALIAAIALAAYVWQYAHSPLPFNGKPQAFTLERGTTMRMAANQLADQGLVVQPWLLVQVARINGSASRIKAGSYEITEAVTPLQLLAKLTDGDVSSATLTIVEGWNWRQVRAALNRHPDLRHDSAQLDDAALMQQLGIQANSPEGQFFPDTYHFAKQSSDLQVLQRAHQAMRTQLDAAWAARAPNLPLRTPADALTLASIIEKETGAAKDRGMISSVFHNRLRIGMRLQTDPTVIYGLGEAFDGNLKRVHLETDTPWNTYTRGGLPPTPIAMPGMASLLAATQPAQSKALYFVAKGDGSSYFSGSLTEHNQAVRRYQLGAR